MVNFMFADIVRAFVIQSLMGLMVENSITSNIEHFKCVKSRDNPLKIVILNNKKLKLQHDRLVVKGTYNING